MKIRLVAAVLLATACAAPAATVHETGSPPHDAAAVTALGPHGLCQRMLPGQQVQAWQSVSVGALRAYQYGGPVAHHPLAYRFGGLPANRAAIWCWVRDSSMTGSLWGVVPGVGIGRAISITGARPANRPAGLMSGPPQVP